MLSVRVTALEQFRIWKQDDEMDVGWLLNRLVGKEEPSDSMKAGTAFHSALEQAQECELGSLAFGDYRFDFNCDCTIALPVLRELEIQKQYGDVIVTGHVDALNGKEITDYKTTAQFDADRFMESYQWRYYLDMADCDIFKYQVFVLAEFGPMHCYEVRQFHTLTQRRYPRLGEDCARLAREYFEFANQIEQLHPVTGGAVL